MILLASDWSCDLLSKVHLNYQDLCSGEPGSSQRLGAQDPVFLTSSQRIPSCSWGPHLEKDRCKEPRHCQSRAGSYVAQDLAAQRWVCLAMAVGGGSREVYREEGISKEMNTEGIQGVERARESSWQKSTRCVGHQPLAGYRVSGEQRPLSAGRFRTVSPRPALDAGEF